MMVYMKETLPLYCILEEYEVSHTKKNKTVKKKEKKKQSSWFYSYKTFKIIKLMEAKILVITCSQEQLK